MKSSKKSRIEINNQAQLVGRGYGHTYKKGMVTDVTPHVTLHARYRKPHPLITSRSD